MLNYISIVSQIQDSQVTLLSKAAPLKSPLSLKVDEIGSRQLEVHVVANDMHPEKFSACQRKTRDHNAAVKKKRCS